MRTAIAFCCGLALGLVLGYLESAGLAPAPDPSPRSGVMAGLRARASALRTSEVLPQERTSAPIGTARDAIPPPAPPSSPEVVATDQAIQPPGDGAESTDWTTDDQEAPASPPAGAPPFNGKQIGSYTEVSGPIGNFEVVAGWPGYICADFDDGRPQSVWREPATAGLGEVWEGTCTDWAREAPPEP